MKMSPGNQSSGFCSGEELEDPDTDSRSISDVEIKYKTSIKSEPVSPIAHKRKYEDTSKQTEIVKKLCRRETLSTSSKPSSSPFRPWSDTRDTSPTFQVQEEPLALVKEKKNRDEEMALDFRKKVFPFKSKLSPVDVKPIVDTPFNLINSYSLIRAQQLITPPHLRRPPLNIDNTRSRTIQSQFKPLVLVHNNIKVENAFDNTSDISNLLSKNVRIKQEVSSDEDSQSSMKDKTRLLEQNIFRPHDKSLNDKIPLHRRPEDIKRPSSAASNHSGTSTNTDDSVLNYKKKSSSHNQNRNYKNMTRERRIEANARERTRVHTISAAFETLRETVPAYSSDQKLSKLSVLRLACSYIMTLSRIAGYDYSIDQSKPSVDSCIEDITKILQSEEKANKKKKDD